MNSSTRINLTAKVKVFSDYNIQINRNIYIQINETPYVKPVFLKPWVAKAMRMGREGLWKMKKTGIRFKVKTFFREHYIDLGDEDKKLEADSRRGLFFFFREHYVFTTFSQIYFGSYTFLQIVVFSDFESPKKKLEKHCIKPLFLYSNNYTYD